MLSEEEKKELLEMAASQALREEFRRLREGAMPPDPASMDLDFLIRFLNAASHFSGAAPTPRTAKDYRWVQI